MPYIRRTWYVWVLVNALLNAVTPIIGAHGQLTNEMAGISILKANLFLLLTNILCWYFCISLVWRSFLSIPVYSCTCSRWVCPVVWTGYFWVCRMPSGGCKKEQTTPPKVPARYHRTYRWKYWMEHTTVVTSSRWKYIGSTKQFQQPGHITKHLSYCCTLDRPASPNLQILVYVAYFYRRTHPPPEVPVECFVSRVTEQQQASRILGTAV